MLSGYRLAESVGSGLYITLPDLFSTIAAAVKYARTVRGHGPLAVQAVFSDGRREIIATL